MNSARYFQVPLFILDTPFCHTQFTDEARKYVRRQIEEYILFLEEVCKKKMDHDRMMEVGKLSVEGKDCAGVLDTAMHKPAPLSAFDAFSIWTHRHLRAQNRLSSIIRGCLRK